MGNVSPLQDMNDFVNTVSDFIELDFVPDGRHSRHDGSGTFEQLAGIWRMFWHHTPGLLSVHMLELMESASGISRLVYFEKGSRKLVPFNSECCSACYLWPTRWDSHFGTPVWRWPAPVSSMRKSMQNVAVTSFAPRRRLKSSA